MADLGTAILNMIMNNPEIQKKINSNGVTKNYYDILRSGDSAKGEALANQIIQTYGLNKEQAINAATSGLQQIFMRGQR